MSEHNRRLKDYFLENDVHPEDARKMLRVAHSDDLREIRDDMTPLFDEISCIAGDILEQRWEQERAASYDGSLTLETLLQQEVIKADVLDTFMHAATNQVLENVIDTDLGHIADLAVSILTTRFKMRNKVWKRGMCLPEKSKSKEENTKDYSPEDHPVEVEE